MILILQLVLSWRETGIINKNQVVDVFIYLRLYRFFKNWVNDDEADFICCGVFGQCVSIREPSSLATWHEGCRPVDYKHPTPFISVVSTIKASADYWVTWLSF